MGNPILGICHGNDIHKWWCGGDSGTGGGGGGSYMKNSKDVWDENSNVTRIYK